MIAREIEIASTDGGTFSAYLAQPSADPVSGIVVIQEVFGVNEFMRGVADECTRFGYVAIVPDLFWRQEPGVQLSDRVEAELSRAFELYDGFDEDKGVEDLTATLNALRSLSGCNGKVGTVGFCLGGKLAYLMATRSDADCNVGYYGVEIERNLDEANRIHHPLMLHIAEEDRFVSKAAQAEIKAGVQGNPWVTIHSYPGANHAFARASGHLASAEAATKAFGRTTNFLQQNLA